MPTHHVYHCPAPPDVELGLTRPNPLRYDVAWPDPPDTAPSETSTRVSEIDGDRPGLLLLIPGFGQDNDDGYLHAFRHWAADRFGLACMTVRYHGSLNRPAQGAQRQFTQPDVIRLGQFCVHHGIPWPDPPATPNLMSLLGQLERAHNQRVAEVQARGEPADILVLTCGLVSPDGPINLGLPQALDHLAALHDLAKRHAFDPANVIALGSSHGGYLAGLINKLAPNTLRAVLDNSGYADPPPRYIDSRSSNLGPDYFENHNATFRFAYHTLSAWTHDANAASEGVFGGNSGGTSGGDSGGPRFYDEDAHALRDLAHPAHLAVSFAGVDRPAVFRALHAPDDLIAPTAAKQDFITALQRQGLDATLRVVDPADVDGRTIKSLDHGLGLSLRRFFQTHFETLPPLTRDHPNDAQRRTTLRFPGTHRALTVQHHPGRVEVSQT